MLEHSITMLRDDDVEIVDDDVGDLLDLVDAWAADLTRSAPVPIEDQDTQVFREPSRSLAPRPAARPGRRRRHRGG